MYHFLHVEFVLYDVTSSFIIGLETAFVLSYYFQRFGFAQAQQYELFVLQRRTYHGTIGKTANYSLRLVVSHR